MDAPPEMSVGIIIGSVLAVILCMAIATGMIVILIKRWVCLIRDRFQSQNKIKISQVYAHLSTALWTFCVRGSQCKCGFRDMEEN